MDNCPFFPPTSAVKGIKSVPSFCVCVCVCVCVCQLVSALTVVMHRMSVLEGLWGENTDKEGTTQEGCQRSGVFIRSGEAPYTA